MATSDTAGEGEGSAPRPGQAFWDGLTRPSLLVVCGALLVAALQVGASFAWITAERLASTPHGRWMSDPWDHSAYVTVEALRMQQGDPSELAVVVVGSSSMRHVFEDHEAFRARLERELAEPVRLHFLPAGGQSLWESAQLLDHLPEGFRGVVLIGVHPERLVYDEEELRAWLEHPRLGLRGSTAAALRDHLGMPAVETTGVYLLDNMAFVAARRLAILRNWVRGPHRYERHGRHIEAPPTEEARAVRDSGAAEAMAHWERGGAEGARALEALVADLRTRGAEVIVAFSPLHPNAERLHPAAFRRFHSMVEDAARRGGARDLDIGARAALVESDFRDIFHIDTRDSRKRCEDALLTDLAEALRAASRARKETS